VSEPLEAGLGFRLCRLSRGLRALWARQLASLGLTPPQAAIVRALAAHPGCSLRALARLLGAEPMMVKRCVDDLEGRELLTSAHRGADRRPRGLELSDQGARLAGEVEVLARHHEGRLERALGTRQRALLEEALGALEADLGLSEGTPGRPGLDDEDAHRKGAPMTTGTNR
jgi:DNA-binding MarR family transcriptional regulator